MILGHIVFDFSGTLAMQSSSGKTELYPDMLTLLEKLKSSGFEIYLWTALSRSSSIRYLEQLKISSFFSSISTASDGFPKPDPRGLDDLLHGVEKNKVVVIGDSPSDMIGAKSFGVYAIGALWNGYSYEEDLLEAGAKIVLKKPLDCFEKIYQVIGK